MEDISTLTQVIKPPIGLRLVIEAAGVLLDAEEEHLPSYSVPSGSRYGPTITKLAQNVQDTIDQLVSVNIKEISGEKETQFLNTIENADYGVEEVGGPLAKHISKILDEKIEVLRKEHLEKRRLCFYTNFLVAVDGSRASYYAFQVALHLHQLGRICVLHVDKVKDLRSHFPAEFIAQDYENEFKLNKIPKKNRKMVLISDLFDRESTATDIAKHVDENKSDFIVLGAYGSTGPRVDQIGHVTMELIEQSTTPVLIVPPSSFHAQDYEPQSRNKFILALDQSKISARCVDVALMLMRPGDILNLVHICNSSDPNINEVIAILEDRLKKSKVAFEVTLCPAEACIPIAEKIQSVMHQFKSTFLILGRSGSGDSTQIGSVSKALIKSPRCNTVICC